MNTIKALFLLLFFSSVSFAQLSKGDSLMKKKLNDAISFYDKGFYTEALNEFQFIIQQQKNKKENKYVQESFLGIAKIYLDLEEMSSARKYLNKSLSLSIKKHDSLYTALTYNSLGTYYRLVNQSDSSLVSYKKALSIFYLLENKQGLAGVNNNIANIYFKQKLFDKALFHYKKSLAIAQDLKIDKDQSLYLLNIGAVYKEMEQLDIAILNYKKAFDIADSSSIKLYKMRAANELYLSYKVKKDYKSTLAYLEVVNELENEIFSSKLQHEISKLQNKSKLDEKANQIIQLKNERNLNKVKLANKNFFIGIMVIALLLLFVIVAGVIRRKNLKQILIREKSDSKSRELVTTRIMQEKKNELLDHIKQTIDSYNKSKDINILINLNNLIDDNIRNENDWEMFKLHFEEVHPNFFLNLKKEHPSLTQNNLKLCAYIKIGLSNKEISRIFNVNPDSIKTAKKRLKKKLNLHPGEDFSF